MSGSINETRYLEIRGVVVTRKDLQDLARYLAKTKDEHADPGRTSLTLASSDGRSYGSADAALLDEDVFDRAPIRKFEASFYSGTESDDSVRIELTHGNSDYGNSIRVSGTDRVWVASTIARLEDLKNAFQPQKFVSKRARWMLTFSSFVGFICFAVAINLVVIEMRGVDGSLWDGMLAGVVLGLLPAIAVAFVVFEVVEKLFPKVELRTGREHMHAEANVRRRLRIILTLVVLPFFISLTAGGFLLAVG